MICEYCQRETDTETSHKDALECLDACWLGSKTEPAGELIGQIRIHDLHGVRGALESLAQRICELEKKIG